MTTEFTPIKATATDWDHDPDTRVLIEEDRKEITELLVGHTVTKADGEHLLLDDGTVIKAIGNDGGCACNAGCYDLAVLNGVENVITDVEFDYRPGDDFTVKTELSGHPDDPTDEWTGYYRVFVYAANEKINLMQFDGTDGNGFYGTGFEILIRDPR